MGDPHRDARPKFGKKIDDGPEAAISRAVRRRRHEQRGVNPDAPKPRENVGVAERQEPRRRPSFLKLWRLKEGLDAATWVGEIGLRIEPRRQDASEGHRA